MDSGNNLIKVPLDSVKLQQIIEDSVGERERKRKRDRKLRGWQSS